MVLITHHKYLVKLEVDWLIMEKRVLHSFLDGVKSYLQKIVFSPFLFIFNFWSAGGSIDSSMDIRKGSPCQQDAHGDSHAAKRMICSIPTLPEVLDINFSVCLVAAAACHAAFLVRRRSVWLPPRIWRVEESVAMSLHFCANARQMCGAVFLRHKLGVPSVVLCGGDHNIPMPALATQILCTMLS